ncbi:MAG TPA: cell division topological specificity factor MinE [Leptolyngbyaceae cyanobacterium M33_DOE_097]|uniref:Cell division topological specificity factor n=1 Tax=Oscillatoriales cyanobacterium SpSt-418 TaxID=2282169 RepID=A0A7C3KGY4_9CYAN|nr:cell division topological specificity factor MinE [Leptolyngbyaceae cyanobacterium M33_DOE_097]
MLIEFLERFFSRSESSSRLSAKNRLKLVLAHDRTDFPPATLEAMRKEILEVVSRYVELDTEAMEFSLENSERTTALIANLPIRRVRSLEETRKPTPAPVEEAVVSEPEATAIATETAEPTEAPSPVVSDDGTPEIEPLPADFLENSPDAPDIPKPESVGS